MDDAVDITFWSWIKYNLKIISVIDSLIIVRIDFEEDEQSSLRKYGTSKSFSRVGEFRHIDSFRLVYKWSWSVLFLSKVIVDDRDNVVQRPRQKIIITDQ